VDGVQKVAIGIAGTGAVAQTLARALVRAGAPVIAVAGRDRERAADAARFAGPSVRGSAYAELARSANRILIATSDDRITAVAKILADAGLRDGVALHTSGARGREALEPLRRVDVACGTLHPLHTIVSPESAPDPFEGVTFGIAGDPYAIEWAVQIIGLVGGRPLPVRDEGMSSYHAAAVLASNAFPALLDSAARLMSCAGVDYDEALRVIAPLARAALENTVALGPVSALTGPVVRGDLTTIEAHIGAIATSPPDVARLYRAVSFTLLELARRRGLAESRLQAIASALDHEWNGAGHGSSPGQDRQSPGEKAAR
jgi:predicted short-subunit dehydrogenase-like oxidoreductase (DUF2520 family)